MGYPLALRIALLNQLPPFCLSDNLPCTELVATMFEVLSMRGSICIYA